MAMCVSTGDQVGHLSYVDLTFTCRLGLSFVSEVKGCDSEKVSLLHSHFSGSANTPFRLLFEKNNLGMKEAGLPARVSAEVDKSEQPKQEGTMQG